MVATIPFDVADELGDGETLVLYFDEALASGDPAYFAHALGKVAKARGMTRIAQEAGVYDTSLHARNLPNGAKDE